MVATLSRKALITRWLALLAVILVLFQIDMESFRLTSFRFDAVVHGSKMDNNHTTTNNNNDNHRLPGNFWQDRLHLLGARLTTSYDTFDESVSFHIFGHAVGDGASGRFNLAAKNTTTENVLLSFKEATQQVLFCQYHDDDHVVDHPNNDNIVNKNIEEADEGERLLKMEYIPTVSIDGNTGGVHLMWGCDLSSVLSRSVMARKEHIRVSMYGSNSISKSKEHIMTLDIPVSIASVGLGGPDVKSSKTPAFVNQEPVGAVLCVSGVNDDGVAVLPEFIQHHINVGVGHFVVGLREEDIFGEIKKQEGESEQTQNKATAVNNTTTTNLQRVLANPILKHYFDQGILVLGQASSGAADFETAELGKLRFYNQCLYHAKGMSEYLLNWDMDELWMPPTNKSIAKTIQPSRLHSHTSKKLPHHDDNYGLWKQSNYSQSMNLVEAVRSLQGPDGCRDWCYQTFSSYTVHRVGEKISDDKGDTYLQGYYGFPVRDAKISVAWQKPVVQTKYAFSASHHIAASCRRPNEDEAYTTMFKHCPLLQNREDDKYGKMHHYQKLFRKTWGFMTDAEAAQYPHVDEYTHFFRPTTVQQLIQLCKRFQTEQSARAPANVGVGQEWKKKLSHLRRRSSNYTVTVRLHQQ